MSSRFFLHLLDVLNRKRKMKDRSEMYESGSSIVNDESDCSDDENGGHFIDHSLESLTNDEVSNSQTSVLKVFELFSYYPIFRYFLKSWNYVLFHNRPTLKRGRYQTPCNGLVSFKCHFLSSENVNARRFADNNIRF